jgi:nicotinamide riboside kinase
MTPSQWSRRADILSNAMHQLLWRRDLERTAYDKALDLALLTIWDADCSAHMGEATRRLAFYRRTEARIERMKARMVRHSERMLEIWQPAERAS